MAGWQMRSQQRGQNLACYTACRIRDRHHESAALCRFRIGPANVEPPERHLKIAYLINEYPKISHSFIRREILALEKEGFEILRLAVRGWDGPLPDEQDR